MINVRPEGRLGNNLFQYVFGRIIQESTGLFYDYSLETNILRTPKIDGLKIENEPLLYVSDYFDIGRDHVLDIDEVAKKSAKRKVLLHGYFQNSSYYKERRSIIKEWLGNIPPTNSKVTGIHIRKSDYAQIKWDLPNSFYDECLKKANPERLFIFTDDINDQYVQELIKRGGELVQNTSPEESMYLLGTCGKQIISRSTFSWWSSFLSSPKVVYYPRPITGWWSQKDTPEKILEIDDSEYYYVDVQ